MAAALIERRLHGEPDGGRHDDEDRADEQGDDAQPLAQGDDGRRGGEEGQRRDVGQHEDESPMPEDRAFPAGCGRHEGEDTILHTAIRKTGRIV